MNNIDKKFVHIDKILEVIPFLKIFVFLVIGITLGVSFDMSFVPVFLAILFSLLAAFRFPYRQLAIYLSLISLGASLPPMQREDDLPLNQEYTSNFVLRDTTKRAEIFQGEDIKSKERFLLIFDRGEYSFVQGDTIGVTVLISEIRHAHYETQRLATIENINFAANVIEYHSLTKLEGDYGVPRPLFERINNWGEERLRGLSLDDENFSILNGMLLGNRGNIGKETKLKYANLGISHILAISGMHILILFFILNLIFFFARRLFVGRVIASGIIILTLILYTLIVGSPISAVRATLMFALLQISNLRPYAKYQNINTLFVAATIIVLHNYHALTDVGFILSFTAVISILIYFPLINSLIPKPNFITNIVVLSLSAQVLTTPIVIYYFGYISTISLVSNLIMSFAAMSLILLAIIHIIIPNQMTDWLICHIMNWVNSLFDYIIEIPYSHINDIPFSGKDTIFLYIIIGMFTYTFISSTKKRI